MTFNPEQFFTVAEFGSVTPHVTSHLTLDDAISYAREKSLLDTIKRVSIYKQTEGGHLPGLMVELGTFISGGRVGA